MPEKASNNRGSSDARVKLALLLVYSLALLLVPAGPWVYGLCVLGVVMACVASPSPRKLVFASIPVIIFAVFALLFAFMADPTEGGLMKGMNVALRMVFLVMASLVVTFSTPSAELLAAFRWALSPARRFGLPVDDIALTLSLALRFIPLVGEEFRSVRMAQASRGGSFAGKGLWRSLKLGASAFIAVFIGLFRRADSIALAMDARCYGLGDDPSSARIQGMSRKGSDNPL